MFCIACFNSREVEHHLLRHQQHDSGILIKIIISLWLCTVDLTQTHLFFAVFGHFISNTLQSMRNLPKMRVSLRHGYVFSSWIWFLLLIFLLFILSISKPSCIIDFQNYHVLHPLAKGKKKKSSLVYSTQETESAYYEHLKSYKLSKKLVWRPFRFISMVTSEG